MEFGYSTLGAPEASFEEAIELAAEFDLDFIELRGLGGTLDLPGYFRNRRSKEKPRVPVHLLASSLSLASAGLRDVEQLLQLAELAVRMKVPYVRVFGGADWGVPVGAKVLRTAASAIGEIRETFRQHQWPVELLLETHGAFSASEPCLALNQLLYRPIGLLWDAFHTWRHGGEMPAQTWAALGQHVRHIHYKDAAADEPEGKVRYVAPGSGQYPTSVLFRLLRAKGYAHGVSLEWEKQWCCELAPLREVLPAFRKVIGGGVAASLRPHNVR